MDVAEERDELRRRLEEGDRRIAEAQRAGRDVSAWEDVWIALLRRYEQACRALEERHPVRQAS
jgi:hypothetical protein